VSRAVGADRHLDVEDQAPRGGASAERHRQRAWNERELRGAVVGAQPDVAGRGGLDHHDAGRLVEPDREVAVGEHGVVAEADRREG
jgi:hypothetical protein